MNIILVMVAFFSVVSAKSQRNLTFVLSAKNLPGNKLNPVVRAYSLSAGNQITKFGESEQVMENGNSPNWKHIFHFTWKKSTQQAWRFDVYNKDSPLTTVTVNVDEYVASGENMTTTMWPKGSITIQKFDTTPKVTPIQFKLSAKNIPKKDRSIVTGSKAEHSDPYVNCYFRKGIKGADTKFATTSTIDNVKDAYWNDVVLFGGYQIGENMYLKLKIKDADTGKDDDIGYALIELDPFWEAGQPVTLNLRDIETDKDTGATITIILVPLLN